MLGVGLGIGLIAVIGTGIYLGVHRTSDSSDGPPVATPPTPVHVVPDTCRRWERIACQCQSREVVSQYCGMAQMRILAIERGEGPTEDCDRLLSAMRQACEAATPAPPAEATEPAARPLTGVDACDELASFACSCGPPSEARNRRCRDANEGITAHSWDSPGRMEAFCAAERTRMETACERDP